MQEEKKTVKKDYHMQIITMHCNAIEKKKKKRTQKKKQPQMTMCQKDFKVLKGLCDNISMRLKHCKRKILC